MRVYKCLCTHTCHNFNNLLHLFESRSLVNSFSRRDARLFPRVAIFPIVRQVPAETCWRRDAVNKFRATNEVVGASTRASMRILEELHRADLGGPSASPMAN